MNNLLALLVVFLIFVSVESDTIPEILSNFCLTLCSNTCFLQLGINCPTGAFAISALQKLCNQAGFSCDTIVK
uniref:Candidate secreted effector n=1 Tax=Meloidogyne incognita TaxID=6306 RepID=A0A914M8T0_MELIC